MKPTSSCVHEADVLDLVWTNQWPARADRSLVEHVAVSATSAAIWPLSRPPSAISTKRPQPT